MTLKEAEKSQWFDLSPSSRWWKWCCDALRNLRTKRWPNGQGFRRKLGQQRSRKTVNFAAVDTNKIELKVLEGVGGFASAAEVHLLKPAKEGQETPEPSQPQPPSTQKNQK